LIVGTQSKTWGGGKGRDFVLLEREVVVNAFMSVVGVTVVLLRDLQIVSAVKASLARINDATS
jgi:hypothetical protein